MLTRRFNIVQSRFSGFHFHTNQLNRLSYIGKVEQKRIDSLSSDHLKSRTRVLGSIVSTYSDDWVQRTM